MEIAEKYHFSDFTLSNFRQILSQACEKYRFASFFDPYVENEKVIILRHDLEFSIDAAVEMAEIEHSLGVKSIVFVNIHSEYYNCFEKRTYEAIKKIEALGHEIGLHMDAHFYGIHDLQSLVSSIESEKSLFRNYFNIEVKAFSFHNTTPQLLGTYKDEYYGGLLNVYSDAVKQKYSYCADSTGFWRYERLEELLLEDTTKAIQILIHDGMWTDIPMSPRRRIYKSIDDNANWLKNYYDETLVNFNAQNIDDNGPV